MITEPHLPVGRACDGIWLYAPHGQLRTADGGRLVICHACGGALTHLSAAHLHCHQLTQASYRAAYGLNRQQSLAAPELAERRRIDGKDRYRHNAALRRGLQQGQRMADDGSLLAASHAAQPAGSRRAQGRINLAGNNTAGRARTAAAAAAARLARAAELGFPNVAAYLTDRRERGWGQLRIAAELHVGHDTLCRLLAETTRRDASGEVASAGSPRGWT